jgi:hypothetical protein
MGPILKTADGFALAIEVASFFEARKKDITESATQRVTPNY